MRNFGIFLCGLNLVFGVIMVFMLNPVAIANFAAAGLLFYQLKNNIC